MTSPIALLLAALAAAGTPPSFPFDRDHPVTVSGIVVGSQIMSSEATGPRAILRLAEQDKKRVWTFDAGTANTLRRGFGGMVEGTKLIVEGYPEAGVACETECRLRMRSVTLPDGRKIFLGLAK